MLPADAFADPEVYESLAEIGATMTEFEISALDYLVQLNTKLEQIIPIANFILATMFLVLLFIVVVSIFRMMYRYIQYFI